MTLAKKPAKTKRNTGRGGYNGCPVVLAIRVGDFRALINGKAEIVASLEPPSATRYASGCKRRRATTEIP